MLQERAGRHVVVDRQERHCGTHGAFEARKWALDPPPKAVGSLPLPQFLAPFWGNCPKCDAAWQAESDARDEAIRTGLTEKQRFAAMRMLAAGIPPRFSGSTIWNWTHSIEGQRKAWEWTRAYANVFELALESGRSGAFCGDPGTGKTHLAIGLLRHVVEKGANGCYVTVMDMLGRIKNTYHRDAPETEQQVIDELTKCDLIVIDEVGRSLDSNYEVAQFFRILDRRYQHRKPTLLVSNMAPADLRKFLGDAAVDRLREAGGAILVFDWASQRSNKARKDLDA